MAQFKKTENSVSCTYALELAGQTFIAERAWDGAGYGYLATRSLSDQIKEAFKGYPNLKVLLFAIDLLDNTPAKFTVAMDMLNSSIEKELYSY